MNRPAAASKPVALEIGMPCSRCVITRDLACRATIAVPSLLSLSTTITSRGATGCRSRARRQWESIRASLRAGITTEMSAMGRETPRRGISVGPVSAAEGREGSGCMPRKQTGRSVLVSTPAQQGHSGPMVAR